MNSSFNVRPLPTFIQGFISVPNGEPINGITVSLPDIDRKTVTSAEGAFGFGFGEPADKMIPPGRYRLLINPGLENRRYGSTDQWVVVEEGRLNSIGIIRTPTLNPDLPFENIEPGTPAVLAGGAVRLTFGNSTRLTFPDNRNEGAVNVQFMEAQDIAYPSLPSSMPLWVYGIQPAGISVEGEIGIDFALPAVNGAYDYLESMEPLVILVGLDPNALQLVPVGVGEIDPDTHRITARGPLHLKRLDFIGYSICDCDQAVPRDYIDGKIGIDSLIGQLEGN